VTEPQEHRDHRDARESREREHSAAPASGQPLWHGRFGEGPSDELLAFTVSLPFDGRLAADDLAGSRAHVAMLNRVGLLSEEERSVVLTALNRVEEELLSGTFVFAPTDEDIHTAVERRVTEIAGAAGAKLHTGRSRNDQIALDLRLYVRREGRDQATRIHALQDVLLRRAEEATEMYLPGYTHLQRAQPVLLAHHLLAHFWSLARDVDRWRDCLARADVSPLGAGALAGSSLPLDPVWVATELGFSRAFENSLDAVSDRDFAAEALFVATLTQVHLSRLGEEIVLWSTDEFGFLRLADAYATGSSMLPQKKNPDIAELARGKAGRLIGNLTGLLATLKGLPLSYNRDLQEDKEPLFDALDSCALSLAALTGLLATVTFVDDRMAAAADSPVNSATDLAEYLVEQGIPFREAHTMVGGLVRQAVERGVPLDELVVNDPRLGPEVLPLLEAGSAVRRRTTRGGGGPEPLVGQLEAARARLEGQRVWLER
jgi:argininosuccinate lyase